MKLTRVCLILSASLLTVYATSSLIHPDNLYLGSMLEDSKKLWLKVTDTIKPTVDRALKLMIEPLTILKSKSKKLEDQTKIDIKLVKEDLLEKLRLIALQPKVLNVDITLCMKNKEQLIINIASNKEKEMLKCLQTKCNSGITIQTNTRKLIDQKYSKVLSIGYCIDNCQTAWESAICVKQVVTQSASQIMHLPGEILDAGGRAVQLIESLQYDLDDCVQNQVDQVRRTGEKVLQDVNQCVDNLC